MDFNNTELERLVKHLGHSVRIQKNFYRKETPAIELGGTKEMLLAVEKGKTLSSTQDQEESSDDVLARSELNFKMVSMRGLILEVTTQAPRLMTVMVRDRQSRK